MNDLPTSFQEFERAREMPRDLSVPDLSEKDLARIGQAVFVSVPPARSDVLFIFGASDGPWNLAAQLFMEGFSRIVLTTGRAGEDFYSTGRPQGAAVRDALVASGVPNEAILVEDGSDNTLENVVLGKAALARAGITARSILFFCKSHHAGRAWRTLARWLPEATLSCSTYDAMVDGVAVSAVDWWAHDSSRRRVYGEFQRMLRYSGRGDIAPLDLQCGTTRRSRQTQNS